MPGEAAQTEVFNQDEVKTITFIRIRLTHTKVASSEITEVVQLVEEKVKKNN